MDQRSPCPLTDDVQNQIVDGCGVSQAESSGRVLLVIALKPKQLQGRVNNQAK
jgi:hypothetical protein